MENSEIFQLCIFKCFSSLTHISSTSVVAPECGFDILRIVCRSTGHVIASQAFFCCLERIIPITLAWSSLTFPRVICNWKNLFQILHFSVQYFHLVILKIILDSKLTLLFHWIWVCFSLFLLLVAVAITFYYWLMKASSLLYSNYKAIRAHHLFSWLASFGLWAQRPLP